MWWSGVGKYIVEVGIKGMYLYLKIDVSNVVRVTVSNTEPEDFNYYEYVKTVEAQPFTVMLYKYKGEEVEETIIEEERKRHPPEEIVLEKTSE
jgi:hypothetical protein